MSKKSNPTLIGAFVVGAVTLLAIGVAVFGGAELFAKRELYVAFFPEQTQGLRRGSNVTMNGSQIGFVSRIVLLINKDTYESTTAVVMEILPESWLVTQGGIAIGSGRETDIPLNDMIFKGGLRAQLQTESLVTGQLLVDMTFQPNTEAVMRGGPETQLPEIPTIPSNVQRIVASIQQWAHRLSENFDADETARRVQDILKGLDELANSEDLRQSLAGASSFINRQETQELTASLEATLEEFRSAAADAAALFRAADGSLDADLKPAIERMVATLDEAKGALAAARFQLRGESPQVYRLSESLSEVEAAARAVRDLMDYLQRNPEALLQGKTK
jgi:paraquat-inducible protein B